MEFDSFCKSGSSNRDPDAIILRLAAYIERLEAQVADLQRVIQEDTFAYARDIAPLIRAVAAEWRLLTMTLDRFSLDIARDGSKGEHAEIRQYISSTRKYSVERQYRLTCLHEEVSKIASRSDRNRENRSVNSPER